MLDQKDNKSKQQILPIPDKMYLTIGEVSKICNVKAHVLRYWEQEFTQLNPSKRRGNRRYYQRKDVLLIREIMSLLYEQGFTIEGARTKLREEKTLVSQGAHYYLLQETITQLEAVVKNLGDPSMYMDPKSSQ
jgi:DNA-binding transcriptional MerR regulator